MLDVDVTRSIAAWVQDRRSGGSAPRASGKPQLQLHVVLDSGPMLLVEVIEGTPSPAGTMLWLGDRGSYEVVLVLRRQDGRRTRSYMRLVAAQLPRAA